MGGLTPYPKYIQPIQFKWGGIGALRATWGLAVVVGDSQKSGIVADWGDGGSRLHKSRKFDWFSEWLSLQWRVAHFDSMRFCSIVVCCARSCFNINIVLRKGLLVVMGSSARYSPYKSEEGAGGHTEMVAYWVLGWLW